MINFKQLILLIFAAMLCISALAQSNNATIKGIITDQNGKPLDMVNIALKDYALGTSSKRDGTFILRVPAQKNIVFVFSSLGYSQVTDSIFAKSEENITLKIIMQESNLKLAEITISQNRREGGNVTRINPKMLDQIAGSSTGAVESLIKTLPGVSSNNELSSQYTVRGGNFDENMVYINDIEVYRPMLVRAGQQEGMSIINSDMVSTIEFSAGGFDAKYKLLILIAHAFGIVAKPDEIFNLGIDKLGDLELNYAREKGLKIKLVAYAEKAQNGKIKAFVLPKFVHKTDKLFNVDDVFNGVKTKSYFSDTQFFVGKGAGAYPTASAVLSDISALTYDYRYEYKKLNQTETLENDDQITLKILLRHNLLNGPTFEQFFDEIHESYRNHESGYTIGMIRLNGLKEINARQTPDSSIILCDVCNANL
jgi:hypothetical protein